MVETHTARKSLGAALGASAADTGIAQKVRAMTSVQSHAVIRFKCFMFVPFCCRGFYCEQLQYITVFPGVQRSDFGIFPASLII